MMSQGLVSNRVEASYLERLACVYVRQSTMRQVLENRTSTERQYALKLRALELGWREEQIIIIDEDQAKSGAYADGRTGFTKFLNDISNGKIGAIFGSELSRVARDSTDWQLLIKLCNIFNALIIEEQVIFDPRNENDRLCLGIKGMFTELELNLIKGRLASGRMMKARQGKLRGVLPIGFIYDMAKNVILDPDEEVQNAIRCVLGFMDRFSSLRAAVHHYNEQNLLFPSRLSSGPNKGVLQWRPLKYERANYILDNPAYAGTYVYGRSKRQRDYSFDGVVRVRHRIVRVKRADWDVVIHGAHEGYITWEQFLRNRQWLEDNRFLRKESSRGAVRSGSALLQGIVLCGNCGRRMKVEYPNVTKHPLYVCVGERNSKKEKRCLTVAVPPLDETITNLLLQAFQPAQLQISIEALQQIKSQAGEHDRHWQLRLDRAQYDADLAYRQFNHVDPSNRLVANKLERMWNERLIEVEQVKSEWASLRNSLPSPLSASEQQLVLSLAEDIPSVWNAATTTHVERKQLLRLMIKDVTLLKESNKNRYSVRAGIRWQAGACTEIYFCPLSQIGRPRTDVSVIALVRKLAESYADHDVAKQLNEGGFRSRDGLEFTKGSVQHLRRRYNIPVFPGLATENGRDSDGRYTVRAAADLLNVGVETIRRWSKVGILEAVRVPPYNNWRVNITAEALKFKKSKPHERTLPAKRVVL